MKKFFLKIWPWLKNKYILTITVFAVWMLFFDQNNMVDRIKMSGEIRQLETDREYYMEEIEKDSARLHELTTDKENLEKYAREQFLMKKKNEDVFVVIERKRRSSAKCPVLRTEWILSRFLYTSSSSFKSNGESLGESSRLFWLSQQFHGSFSHSDIRIPLFPAHNAGIS